MPGSTKLPKPLAKIKQIVHSIIHRDSKQGLSPPSSMYMGEKLDSFEDSLPLTNLTVLNEERKKNGIMRAYHDDMMAMVVTDYTFIPAKGYESEGVDEIEDFLKRFSGAERELTSNIRDVASFLLGEGTSVYKREQFHNSNINGGVPITLRRSFFEMQDVDEMHEDKYGNISEIKFKDTESIKGALAAQFHKVKQGTTSNRVWGKSKFHENFHLLQRCATLFNIYVMGIERQAAPIIKVSVDEGKLEEIFRKGANYDEPSMKRIKQNAQTWVDNISKNIRKTTLASVKTTDYTDVEYLMSAQQKDMHSEVREIFSKIATLLGWGELLVGVSSNKSDLAINARQVQNVSVKPLRKIIIDDFIIPEINNWFMQLGKIELMDSVTVKFKSSEAMDPEAEARMNESIVRMVPQHARVVAENAGSPISDEEIASASERVSQRTHEKPPIPVDVKEDK